MDGRKQRDPPINQPQTRANETKKKSHGLLNRDKPVFVPVIFQNDCFPVFPTV